MRSECLLELDKTREAVEEWEKCEADPQGRIEMFQSLISDVHRRKYPNVERGKLIAKRKHRAENTGINEKRRPDPRWIEPPLEARPGPPPTVSGGVFPP